MNEQERFFHEALRQNYILTAIQDECALAIVDMNQMPELLDVFLAQEQDEGAILVRWN